MGFIFSILPILIVATLIVLAVLLGKHFETKRKESLQKLAADLGLEFFPLGIPDLMRALRGFRIVSAGDSHTLSNIIRGITDEVELTIFDLTYSTGSGKSRSTQRQTVIRFASGQLRLPEFAVSPEWFFQKIAKLFGMKDINFAEDPTFSSAFLLQGANEPAIRQLFGPEVRAWFAGRAGVTAEGRGGQLLFFRADQRVSPDKIPALLDEGFQLFKLLAVVTSGPNEAGV